MAILKRDDGVCIYYEPHGEGPNVILLTHGYGATAQMWRGQIEPLSKTHKLVLWDMRGHGQSDSPEDQALYCEDATVADMAALLDHVGARTAIIGGLSLGGYMSLGFRRAHPDRVSALMLFDTGPGYKSDQAREDWNKTAGRRAERFESEGLDILKRGSAESATAQHRSAAGLARAARGMLAQRDARVINSLPDIREPTLIIVGSEDKPYLAATDYMTAKIPGAYKVVIEGAGHSANIDKPAPFNAAVVGFLESLSG